MWQEMWPSMGGDGRWWQQHLYGIHYSSICAGQCAAAAQDEMKQACSWRGHLVHHFDLLHDEGLVILQGAPQALMLTLSNRGQLDVHLHQGQLHGHLHQGAMPPA